MRLNVHNQSIFWRRGYGLVGGGVGNWYAEEELTPGLYSLNDRCDAIQVRARDAGRAACPKASQQAQVERRHADRPGSCIMGA